MTHEEKQHFFEQYGVMPITDDYISESEKIDISKEEVLRLENISKKQKAKQYLIDTDWYVVRKAETGIDIPEDILEKRIQARLEASN